MLTTVDGRFMALAALFLAAGACTRQGAVRAGTEESAVPAPSEARAAKKGKTLPLALGELELGAPLPAEPNGENDGVARDAVPTTLAEVSTARLVPLADLPDTAHRLVCDLTPLEGKLFVSHAVDVIDRVGARIHRYDPTDGSWALVFDWNRGGEPGHSPWFGGEAFTRLRVLGDRLYVPDADTPGPAGFGRTEALAENYVFKSLAGGSFPELLPGQLPPLDTISVPLGVHAFDVIPYGDAVVVSGGLIELEPDGNPHGRVKWPAALFAGEADALVYPPRAVLARGYGVVRTTYFHRFGGRLYVGLQNNRHAIRWDLAVVSGDLISGEADVQLARITPDGGWLTRAFASDASTLYWVGGGYSTDDRGGILLRSRDGRSFEEVVLPEGSGKPLDLLIDGAGVRWLLTTAGLFRAERDDGFVQLASAPEGNVFDVYDPFCSAPMTLLGGELYVGAMRGGVVYRVVPA